MDSEIAVVGSCNLDLVVPVHQVPELGETVLGGDLRRVPGGKGANQAVAAARLGRTVAIVGRVGADDAGLFLRAALEADGVDTSSLLETPGVASGVALIAVQSDGDNSIVVSPGANAHLTSGDVNDATVVSEAKVVLVQAEIPLGAVVEAARVATGVVIWNPAPAPTDGFPLELLESVDVLVTNQTELAALTGHLGSVDRAVAMRLARGLPAASVVVTLGADGALVVSGDAAVHVPAPVVRPVDTTAAGDSFCAALADQLVVGADLVAAASWATRVGAATTLREGAQPSLPTRAEVEALLASAP
ncbi:MAG: ribokinase [Acidimicrobiales bacterium]